jgi:hypothetical protein
MGDFSLIKRKTSAYLPRNELHSEFNRKISAYFIFAGNHRDGSFGLLLAKLEPRENRPNGVTMEFFNQTFTVP